MRMRQQKAPSFLRYSEKYSCIWFTTIKSNVKVYVISKNFHNIIKILYNKHTSVVLTYAVKNSR